MLKKGDDDDDEVNDEVRTTVPGRTVWAQHWVLRNLSSGISYYSFPLIQSVSPNIAGYQKKNQYRQEINYITIENHLFM